jgi:hypothetical protein
VAYTAGWSTSTVPGVVSRAVRQLIVDYLLARADVRTRASGAVVSANYAHLSPSEREKQIWLDLSHYARPFV